MSSAKTQSVRSMVRLAHLWLGLVLCVPLVLLGLTGTILVFENMIAPPRSAAAIGEAQPISAIIAAAARAAPQNQHATQYSAPSRGGPAIVRFSAARQGGGPGPGAQIAVDPMTLAVLDTQNGAGFMRQVHRLHANLLMSGRAGRSLVGWLGVVMLAMGVSGLVIWWPRPGRWAAALTVARDARGPRLHRQLHGATGIWGLVVFVVVSFTGVSLAFPETMAGAIGIVLPGAEIRPAAPPAVAPIAGRAPIDADRALALAIAAMPGATVKSIGLPMQPEQPYRIGLIAPGGSDGTPVATAFIDPWAARLIEIRDPATLAMGGRVVAWQRAIHAGAGLGPVWHGLVGLCGLLPILFAVTGISMWLSKRRSRRGVAAARATAISAAE